MKIAWFQYDIKWQNSQYNLDKISKTLESCTFQYDLLVLPEMFDTGFVTKPHLIENRDQQAILNHMLSISKKYDSDVCFTMVWKLDDEKESYVNRAFYISGGKISHYDKTHLFAPGGESDYYQAGNERIIVESKTGVKILPLICYDLRFPEIARNTDKNIDLILYPASWPDTRIQQWDALLKARAIENQCYALGVNRTGTDAHNLNYVGHSRLFNFLGEEVITNQDHDSIQKETLFIAEINLDKQLNYRQKLPFLNDIRFV